MDSNQAQGKPTTPPLKLMAEDNWLDPGLTPVVSPTRLQNRDFHRPAPKIQCPKHKVKSVVLLYPLLNIDLQKKGNIKYFLKWNYVRMEDNAAVLVSPASWRLES